MTHRITRSLEVKYRRCSFGGYWSPIASALTIVLAWTTISQAQQSEQQPTVQEALIYSSTADNSIAVPMEQTEAIDWNEGATPDWIWGPSNDVNYDLTKTIELNASKAHLITSGDNSLTLWINDQRVTQDDSWESATQKDVSQFLQEGENTIRVRVGNQGGPAGFVFKLRVWDDGDEVTDVVSDESWIATAVGETESTPVRVVAQLGAQPWGNVFSSSAGPSLLPEIPRDTFVVREGFQIELLYDVNKATQGSWVAFTFDPQGRIIASDQGNQGLWRITPSSPGSNEPTKVEKLEIGITAAQGLLCAFDSLYLSVNGGPGSGFYRAKDTDGDDQYDEVTLLKPLRGGGEHGPHALRLSPDGNSIYLIAGNHTDPPADFQRSRIPSTWQEDLLLPRQWDARGHARGKLAPGGWIAITDPDGSEWEMYSVGYRNPYDMDFDSNGQLFAYDADMEWDMGASWYRPTRVVHATSGSEFGWRSGTGKWPEYYPDSLPAVVDIGPGSPTGVCFGTGADFPASYQRALYLCDWTFGTMYAIHFEAKGGTYVGRKEEFLSRSPLPLTDVEIGPDGAMYFTVGGRGTNSALYRVSYVGEETPSSIAAGDQIEAHRLSLSEQSELAQFHQPSEISDNDYDYIWQRLGSQSRNVRYAARMGLEHRAVSDWIDRFEAEEMPDVVLNAALAVARADDESYRDVFFAKLNALNTDELNTRQQIDLVRAYGLGMIRLGDPNEQGVSAILSQLSRHLPSDDDRLNRELAQLLVYLNDATVIDKALTLFTEANERREHRIPELLARNAGYGNTIAQMLANSPDADAVHYALILRNMKFGWTLEQRQHYFELLGYLSQRSGGASYQGFISNIRSEALENCLPAERLALESVELPAPPNEDDLPKPFGPGQEWTVENLVSMESQLSSGRDFELGKRAYFAAQCASCHRFAGVGGSTGPDLTNVAGRFSLEDLAKAIIHPSEVVSDQYQAHLVQTTDGRVLTGRVLSDSETEIELLIDPIDITQIVTIAKEDIEEFQPSPTSLMPNDLVQPLNREELLDLLAFLFSRGNESDRVFASED